VVRELVAAKQPSFICLSETKLHVMNDYDILQMLGQGFDYVFLPSIQTHGGILIAWSRSSWSVSNIAMGSYSVTAKVKHVNGGLEWWLTTFYGPMVDSEKLAFLDELQGIRQARPGPWLVNRDFNMIYSAVDKNNPMPGLTTGVWAGSTASSMTLS
jgi:hypothetical protein